MNFEFLQGLSDLRALIIKNEMKNFGDDQMEIQKQIDRLLTLAERCSILSRPDPERSTCLSSDSISNVSLIEQLQKLRLDFKKICLEKRNILLQQQKLQQKWIDLFESHYKIHMEYLTIDKDWNRVNYENDYDAIYTELDHFEIDRMIVMERDREDHNVKSIEEETVSIPILNLDSPIRFDSDSDRYDQQSIWQEDFLQKTEDVDFSHFKFILDSETINDKHRDDDCESSSGELILLEQNRSEMKKFAWMNFFQKFNVYNSGVNNSKTIESLKTAFDNDERLKKTKLKSNRNDSNAKFQCDPDFSSTKPFEDFDERFSLICKNPFPSPSSSSSSSSTLSPTSHPLPHSSSSKTTNLPMAFRSNFVFLKK
ncbi:hypothetical protein SSS_03284 [Sarcoptes scabiei]|uniref:Uncharacterized protein n=1 Tax=Sarcoptes scabiei TaxID=52283 RepID=A0A834RAY7_SARSC|nr:hypothetical protein SSS_03284 [Sarcoptes scabiei]